MQHLRFKAEQTAAHYVAHGLDEKAQEAFELHMMDCAECVSDVEVWRTVKQHLPEAANEHLSATAPDAGTSDKVPSSTAAPYRSSIPRAHSVWRAAAGIATVAVLAGSAGWYGHSLRGPGSALADGEVLFYNLPATTRSADCTALPVSASASVLLLRIPGAMPNATVVAQDLAGRALPSAQYRVRAQDDGSWVVQFQTDALRKHPIALSVQQPGGAPEALGCITAH